MKEIKFRAWREDIEVMEDVREMVWDNNGLKKQTGEQFLNIVGFREFESYTGAGDLKNVVIMQYTGLTDKNGVEIYEGDIVKYYDHTRDEYVVSPVKWNAPMFVVESGLLFFRSKGADMKFSGEVIGNIYQNKDLLKE